MMNLLIISALKTIQVFGRRGGKDSVLKILSPLVLLMVFPVMKILLKNFQDTLVRLVSLTPQMLILCMKREYVNICLSILTYAMLVPGL